MDFFHVCLVQRTFFIHNLFSQFGKIKFKIDSSTRLRVNSVGATAGRLCLQGYRIAEFGLTVFLLDRLLNVCLTQLLLVDPLSEQQTFTHYHGCNWGTSPPKDALELHFCRHSWHFKLSQSVFSADISFVQGCYSLTSPPLHRQAANLFPHFPIFISFTP